MDTVDICCSQERIQEISEKISDVDPQIVLAVTPAADLAFLVQYAELFDFHPNWIGTIWAGKEELIKTGGAAADGIELAMAFNPDIQTEEYLAFKNTYRNTYGLDPLVDSVFGYTIIQYLATGLIDVEGKKEGLKESLLEHNQINSIQGMITIDQFGDANWNIYINRIIDGIYEPVNIYYIE